MDKKDMSTGKTKIFVDGNCIVCSSEISHYKSTEPDKFDIIDISSNDFIAEKYNLTPEAVNKNMHAITPEGEVVIGIDAFAHIWSRIEKYSFGEKVIKLPVVYQLAKVGYRVFASCVRPLLPKKNR